jgi:AcrR family transcriptional regulator
MRGLARRLGIAPMALYNHVSSREDLIDRLRDAVFATIELPEPSADRWRQQLRDHTLQAVAALADHPGLLRATSGRRQTPGEARLVGYSISLLLEAGFEPREAALALTAYNAQVFGFAVVADQTGGRRRTRGKRTKAARPPVDANAATVQHLLELELQTALEYAIDTLLDGLQARLERSKSERVTRQRARAPRQKRA